MPLRWLRSSGIVVAALGAVITYVVILAQQRGPATIVVDPSTSFQTILGWGASSTWQVEVLRVLPRELKDQMLDDAVDELGLTRLRQFTSTKTHLWEPTNDNSNPGVTDWSKFNTEFHDLLAADLLLPFKSRLRAGEPLELYLSDSNTGVTGMPDWLLDDPDEYAESIVTLLIYLRDKHGLVPQYYVIQNEPTNNSPHATPEFHRDVIRAAGPRLIANNLTTRFQIVDGIDAQLSWNYIRALESDREIWPFVGAISYHHYGPIEPFRGRLRTIAKARNLPMAQTETSSASVETLFDDLVLGDVSYWEVAFGLMWFGDEPIRGDLYTVNRTLTGFARHPSFWSFRQITRNVRPGAVRIGTRSDQGDVRVVAFRQPGGITLALHNAAVARQVTITGLPSGTYALSQSIADRPPVSLATRTIGQNITLEVPADTVVAIVPVTDNQPPAMVETEAEPAMLYAPAQDGVMSVVALDPEGDPLTYRWSIATQPEGADARIGTPTNASTAIWNLAVAGRYVAQVEVSDGTHTIRRPVLLKRVAGNAAPVVVALHNSNPARLELPGTATNLQAEGLDPENDQLTYRWTLVNQPPGARVTLETPSQSSTRATGLSVSGAYEFRVTVGDGRNAVNETLRLTMHPESPRRRR